MAFFGHQVGTNVGDIGLWEIGSREFLYGNKFTIEEMQDIKLMIQSNIYKYLNILLDGRERFEEETMPRKKSIGPNDQVSEAGGEVDSNENIQCVYSINPINQLMPY